MCACVSGFDPYTPGEVSSVVGNKGAMWSHLSMLVVCVHLCVSVGGGGDWCGCGCWCVGVYWFIGVGVLVGVKSVSARDGVWM